MTETVANQKKFIQYNNYIDSFSAANNNSNLSRARKNTSGSRPVSGLGGSVRQKTNKVEEYSANRTLQSTGIPPRYRPTTSLSSSKSVAIVSPDLSITKSLERNNYVNKALGAEETSSYENSGNNRHIEVRRNISSSAALVEPDEDDQVGKQSAGQGSSHRNKINPNSNTSYGTLHSSSSHGGGSRGGHSSATPIVSNRLQQQPSSFRKAQAVTANRINTLSQPKQTKKSANLLAAHNVSHNNIRTRQTDKGDEGITTKSCLTLRLPSIPVATESSLLPRQDPSSFVALGKFSNNSNHTQSIKADTSCESNSINNTSKMPLLKSGTSRFGWVRRKENNYPGSTSGNTSHGATSQASSSVVQLDDDDNALKNNSHCPNRECHQDLDDADVEFPPSSSWADGSLASTQSHQKKQQQCQLPVLRDNSNAKKNNVSFSPSGTASTPTQQNMKDLFSPPPVQDRGSDRRKIKEYELEKRRSRRGLFEGEIEPEGIRGQEANVGGQRKKKGFFSSPTAAATSPSPPNVKLSSNGMLQPRLSISSSTTSSSVQAPSRDFVSPAEGNYERNFRVISSVASESSTTSEMSNKLKAAPYSKLQSSSLLLPSSSSISSQDGTEDDNRYYDSKDNGNDAGQSTTKDQSKPPMHISHPQHQNRVGSSALPPTIPSRTTTRKDLCSSELLAGNNRGRLQKQESDITDSTCSDEAIQDMLPDLLPKVDASPLNSKLVGRGVHENSKISTTSGGVQIPTGDSGLRRSQPGPKNPRSVHPASSSSKAIKSSNVMKDDFRKHSTMTATGNGSISSSNDTPTLNNTGRSRLDTLRTNNANEAKQVLPQSSVRVSVAGESSLKMKSFDLTKSPARQKPSTITRTSSEDKPSTSPGTSTTGDVSSTESPSLSEVDALNALAVQHVNAGRFDDALLVFTRVLQIHQETNGVNVPNPNTSSAYHNLGTVHAKRAQALEQVAASANNGELSEEQKVQQTQARASALQCFQAAARLARDSLGRNHPNVAVSLVRIGFLLLQSKQYDNADTTFSEALRIRLEHYGSEHSLVANLYNNLGVCRMHLGKFEKGLESLEEALKIQHTIIIKTRDSIRFESGGSLSVKDVEQDGALVAHRLELADTLFNIGGLCLEWIRRDGDKYDAFKQKRRSMQAYRAFEEALNIRLLAYKNNRNHPSVVQVQNLLRTAEHYKTLQQQKQEEEEELQHASSKILNSPSLNSSSWVDQSSEGTPSSLAKTIPVQSLKFDTPNSKSPFDRTMEAQISTICECPDAEAVAPKTSDSNGSPPIGVFQNRNIQFQENLSPIGKEIRDVRETTSSMKSEDNSTQISSSALLPKRVQIVDKVKNAEHVKESSVETLQSSSIFRGLNSNSSTRASIQMQNDDNINENAPVSRPPISEVMTVSMDIDDENSNFLGKDGTAPVSKRTRGTRIYVAPHNIPKTSPARPRTIQGVSPGGGRNSSDDPAYNSLSLASDNFSPDISKESNHSSMQEDDESFLLHKPLLNGHSLKSWSYDGEENCLIRNTGVDSDRGRIHFPLRKKSSQSSGSQGEVEFTDSYQQRDIMVTHPIPAVANKSIQPITSSFDNGMPVLSKASPLPNIANADIDRATSFDSKQWGGTEVSFSTGNKERDEIMNRARAILELSTISSVDDQSDGEESVEAGEQQENATKIANQVNDSLKDGDNNVQQNGVSVGQPPKLIGAIDQDYLEDGVAPLGGMGLSMQHRPFRSRDMQEMLKDPMTCLPEIHEEASRQLTNNNSIDAIHLFETILRCQRRRFGALHPDVAAALHNVGLGHLRAQNHVEALKAFEEAARVRKGSLGKDHPLVAVSLVKVGITLLLLHRFEEALWSFREALSVRKNSLGPLHPSTARIYNNIGCVYVEFNEYRQARRAFEAALDTQRNALVHEPNSGPLMFGTATTLCNLGYLYRIRSMHDKATAVLKEAAELQEIVLGKYHSTVLSTLDNLADSCCNSGNGNEALRYYNTVLERFQLSGTEFGDRNNKRSFRAESILHYKMSRVHRLRNDRENQLTSLQLALKAVRAVNDCNNSSNGTEGVCLSSGTPTDSLERRLLSDIRVCRELMEKEELKWI